MKTVREVLNTRKIDCHVETADCCYAGLANNLLSDIPEADLELEVSNFWLDTCGSQKQWQIQTTCCSLRK